MKTLGLILSLAFFVGGLMGLFLGLVFGGARGRWLDYIYGPEQPEEELNER